MLLDGARIAIDKFSTLLGDDANAKDSAYYEGKKHAALLFAHNVLPNVNRSVENLLAEDASPTDIPIDIPTDGFASV